VIQMSAANPAVSVVMPSYNHEAYVELAVRSVLAQSFGDLELIVIDDGSSDRSCAVLSALAAQDARVRLVFRPNKGAPATINEGISLARGKWVGIINSDDLYAPDRLKRMLLSLESHDATWGFSRVELLDAAGAPAAAGSADWYREIQREIATWPTIGFSLLKHNVILTTGNLFFERCLFDLAGPFRELQLVHDWDFALRLLRHAEPVFVEEELYSYRLHGTNTIRSIPQSTTDREVGFVLRDFFLSVTAQRPRNSVAPSPYTWPDFFGDVIRRQHFQGCPYEF
jgi:glycosyltransferase involved in cell wall biosynthesis